MQYKPFSNRLQIVSALHYPFLYAYATAHMLKLCITVPLDLFQVTALELIIVSIMTRLDLFLYFTIFLSGSYYTIYHPFSDLEV